MIGQAKQQSLAPGAPATKRRWPFSLWRELKQDYVLETQGTEFALSKLMTTKTGITLCQTAPRKLEHTAFQTTLSELGYIGQPITIVLHPPCVCLKSRHLENRNPESWLSQHLADISPPVNRRELAMSYQYSDSDQLLVAFVRRSFLSELSELTQSARVSVDRIVVGGVITLQDVLGHAPQLIEVTSDFALCSYRLIRSGGEYQVFADRAKPGETGQSSPTVSSISHSTSSVVSPSSAGVISAASRDRQSIDFRTHMGLPKAAAISLLERLLRAEFLAIALLAGLMIAYWGVVAINGNASSDSDYQSMQFDLESLRQKNATQSAELETTVLRNRPTYVTSEFLRTVAALTPGKTTLSSIKLERPEGRDCVFTVTGFSRDGSEALEFTDSLRNDSKVKSTSLTRVGLAEAPDGRLDRTPTPARWTRFEIAGEYAGE